MSTNIRMDVPTAMGVAVVGVIVAIILTLIFSVLELSGVIFLANPIALLIVGILYARLAFRKVKLSYVEAAAGGAVSGGTAGFLVIIVGAIVGAILNRIDFPYTTGLAAVSANTLASALLNAIIVGAALAALGAAWVVLVRTQRIEA